MMHLRWHNPKLFGGLIILLGVVLLASTLFDLVIGSLIWPGILMLVGGYLLWEMIQRRYRYGARPFPWPGFLILWGAFDALKVLGLIPYSLSLGPLLLIAIGLSLLWGRR